MKDWIVQYRHVKSNQEWQTATPRKTLYWDENIAKWIADQSNKVDLEGFEWRAVRSGDK